MPRLAGEIAAFLAFFFVQLLEFLASVRWGAMIEYSIFQINLRERFCVRARVRTKRITLAHPLVMPNEKSTLKQFCSAYFESELLAVAETAPVAVAGAVIVAGAGAVVVVYVVVVAVVVK